MDGSGVYRANEQSQRFIDEKVASGRYSSMDDIINAGLRLIQYEERKYDRLAELLAEGQASGPAEPWDYEAFLREEGLLDDDEREAA